MTGVLKRGGAHSRLDHGVAVGLDEGGMHS
jgi:hypothetical protein